MKNWLLIGVLAITTITFICCNQQEDLLPTTNELKNTSTTVIQAGVEPEPSILAKTPTFCAVEKEEGDEEGGTDAAKVYCVYDIKTATPGSGHIKAGNQICIECPNNETCPGSNYSNIGGDPSDDYSPFVFVDAGGDTLSTGTWRAAHFNEKCRRCVWGRKGYVFK